ncbi:uncharacterized protein LOC100285341 [Zea mays]|uniref:uncharacterized protein LOC100285341 n=1 Tax=Zea mays TaxID=4577 RepID=UPI000FF87FC6|nr:uncharacterized protein LOC100285341 [Zea mays]
MHAPMAIRVSSSVAATASNRSLLLVVAGVALALLASPSAVSARRRPVRLRLYMHDIVGGPGQTAVRLVKGPAGPGEPVDAPGQLLRRHGGGGRPPDGGPRRRLRARRPRAGDLHDGLHEPPGVRGRRHAHARRGALQREHARGGRPRRHLAAGEGARRGRRDGGAPPGRGPRAVEHGQGGVLSARRAATGRARVRAGAEQDCCCGVARQLCLT